MNLPPKVKDFLSFVLRFGLSAVLLVYLYHRIDWAKTIEIVKTADKIFIGYAFLSFLSIYVFLVLRWMIFLRAMDVEVPLFTCLRYYFIGLFGNLFLPSSIGGDVLKIWGLCRATPHKAKVVASVLLDRLSGFAGIVVVAVLAFAFGFNRIQDLSLLISIAVMAGFSFLTGVVLLNEKIYEICCRIFNAFPKIKDSLMHMHYDIALLKDRPYAIYQSIAASCLCQIILSITFFLLSKALHQETSFIYFLIFIPLICVASSMPSIGGLGVREAGAVYLFAKAGMAAGVSVSISLINFLFMVIVGLLSGLFFVLTKSPGETLPNEAK